jgi:peroxiredoxin
MTTRAQWLVVLALVAVLAGGLTAATLLLGDDLFPVEAGSRAPDFSAVTLDEPPVRRTLADYRGKVVLLNVWATWCAPCVWEMPSMERLHRVFGDSGLAIVAVSVDELPGSKEAIRDFVGEHGLTFEVLHDPAKEITRTYKVSGYPESFVIGRDGIVRRKVYVQDWSTAANRALIAQLLREEVPPTADSTDPPH